MTLSFLKYHKSVILFFFVLIIISGCKDRFEADIKFADTGFLVVEGYINIGDDAVTKIILSRTTPIDEEDEDRRPEYVSGATVAIEDEDNQLFFLNENSDGVYLSSPLDLSSTERYRLTISVNDKVYVSEFVTPIVTPEIDSVTWKVEPDGVRIYVNSHGNTDASHYYQWEYDEVWETNPPKTSFYDYPGWGNRSAEEIKIMQTCWKYRAETEFNLFSTKSLTDNVVLKRPVNLILTHNERLSIRYSIIVRQHSLSEEAYDYIQLMRKNSESVGGFSDPLPGELTGNIFSTSTSEPVVGFIAAYTTTTKRIFIHREEITVPWDNTMVCPETLLMFEEDAGQIPAIMEGHLAISFHYLTELVRDGVYVVPNECADCRINGGTNIRPPFWEIGADEEDWE